MSWQPMFGATVSDGRIHFRVWAPEIDRLEVVLSPENDAVRYPLAKGDDDCFTGIVAGGAGALYKYRVNGQDQFPDPAARFQPDGVHGPSEVIDPTNYHWGDSQWTGLDFDQLVIYELHVGTFSEAGTFAGVAEKLAYLKELGVTAIQLMPVGDFPGQRNWGYDGVALYAPARCYGRPDDLRRLVDEAHQIGLAVLLDVVYNHLGPDGNYLGVYSRFYNSTRHQSPWGAAMNFDEEHSQMVRTFFIDNALQWLHDYHFDGLRLDATHAIQDDSDEHFLAELSQRVREHFPDRKIHLIAEDHRNLAHMMRPRQRGGWGLDGVWADDFHHQVRRLLAGDNEGYYRDFRGTTEDLATTANQGWYYTGQYSQHLEEPRGSDPSELLPPLFVICLQNHDQIGNRAFGERLHQQIDEAAWRAASVLLLCAPQTPLLFMGQEWAASTPFLYFTDHNDELGKLVTQGRRKEFRHFSAFSDPRQREKIPDPQAEKTFLDSRLIWDERNNPPHDGVMNLYQTLFKLRREEPALQSARREDYRCLAANDDAVVLMRKNDNGPGLLTICQMRGSGDVEFGIIENLNESDWEVVLTTEDASFVKESKRPRIEMSSAAKNIRFERPGAVVLRG